MINRADDKIECPSCGHNDWYVLGRHRTCRPCNAASQRRYAERQRVGRDLERHGHAARSLAASLVGGLPAVAVRRRQRQTCRKGHPYAGNNLAWRTDKLGRQYRQCLTCHRDVQRSRYGMSRPSSLATLLGDALTEQGS